MILDVIKRIDKVLIIIPALFGIISCFMISSIDATAAAPYSSEVNVQVTAFCIGYGILALMVVIDYKKYFKFDKLFYAAALALQCLVFVPGVGMEIFGTTRWINLGFTTVQPSEFAKVFFVIYYAAYLTRNKEHLKSFIGFVFAFLYGIPIVGLVAYTDLGSGIVLIVMLMSMTFAAGLRAGLVLRISAIFVILVPIIYRFLSDYQKERFAALLHPDDLSIDAVHQVYQAKVAIGSGGFLGKGFRQGIIKESGLLPVQDSDFIFPIICEEFGFVGGVIVIALYFALIIRIWWIIAKTTELFGALIAVGFMSMFAFQAFENIGMCMGLMPVTGITLPMVSAGGSSVVACMAALGLVISVHFRDTSRGLQYW